MPLASLVSAPQLGGRRVSSQNRSRSLGLKSTHWISCPRCCSSMLRRFHRASQSEYVAGKSGSPFIRCFRVAKSRSAIRGSGYGSRMGPQVHRSGYRLAPIDGWADSDYAVLGSPPLKAGTKGGTFISYSCYL